MKRKIVLMLCGPSGCGKSTLEKNLADEPNVTKVVSVTTRPPREGEVDGVDYHFITEEGMYKLDIGNQLIQTTKFGGNFYGSLHSSYTTEHDVATLVVVPSSAATFKKLIEMTYPEMLVKIVYFDISERRLIRNMVARGDDMNVILERLEADDLRAQFESAGLEPDYIVSDDTLNEQLFADVKDWLNTMIGTENGS